MGIKVGAGETGSEMAEAGTKTGARVESGRRLSEVALTGAQGRLVVAPTSIEIAVHAAMNAALRDLSSTTGLLDEEGGGDGDGDGDGDDTC